MLRLALCLFTVLFAFRFSNADDTVSMAIGVQGVREIVNSSEWQDELDVSPEQLGKLKQMFADQELLAQIPGVDGFLATHGTSFDSETVRMADKIYRERYTKILTTEQLNERRLRYLRKHFPYPLDLFNSRLFEQIGLTSQEFEQLQPAWFQQALEARNRVDTLRTKFVGKLIEISPAFKEKFVECFGNSLLPPSASSDGQVRQASIGIVEADRGQLFLNSARYLVLPKCTPISRTQREQLDKLGSDLLIRTARDPAFNGAKMAMDGVKDILDDSQLVAIAECHHQHALRSDFNVLASKAVLTYLKADNAQADAIRALCQQAHTEIHSARVKIEMESLKAISDSLPKDSSSLLNALLSDVWHDRN